MNESRQCEPNRQNAYDYKHRVIGWAVRSGGTNFSFPRIVRNGGIVYYGSFDFADLKACYTIFIIVDQAPAA